MITVPDSSRFTESACVVLKARRIYDLGDPNGRPLRSLAFRNGRVVASATDPDRLDGLAESREHIRDLGDLTFIPGFFDSHIHILWAGLDDLRTSAGRAHRRSADLRQR